MKFYTNVSIRGNNILLRGFLNGHRVHEKIPYKPYLFVPTKNETKYKSLFGKKLDRVNFDSISDAKDFLKRYNDVSGFEIYGLDKFIYPFINDKYSGTIEYDQKYINIMNIDIEVKSDEGFPEPQRADKEITAITIKRRDLIIALGCGDYNAPEGVLYLKCKDEEHLLLKFITIWKKIDPDIITGWNVEFFDIPYIVNRIKNILGEDSAKMLSPWGMLDSHEMEDGYGRIQYSYTLRGVTVLDYLQLYRKFTYTNQESYKLDHIAFVELNERKLDYSEYEGLHDLYKKDYKKFMDYNIHDVMLVDRLDKKLNLLSLALTVAYDAKINYEDVFTSVRLWDTIIHNHLMNKNVIISKANRNKKDEQFAGAFVKIPLTGMHKDVASFDVESLYPSLIVQYNISPETFRAKTPNFLSVDQLLDNELERHPIYKKIKSDNLAITANGCLWDRDIKGVFPELVEKMMIERKLYKKKMLEAKQEYELNKTQELENKIAKYDNLQMARKIQLNSLYGALGNQYFRWFEINFAEAITLTGQLAIRWIEKNINAYINSKLNTHKDYVIAIDTDSVYLNLNDLLKQSISDDVSVLERINALDKLCSESIQNIINDSFTSFVEYTNAYTSFLKMKREALADKGIWTAKKRYILNVYDNEGVRYAEPKLKMMGIEAVKSSTPAACRVKIKDALKIIMMGTEDDVIEFIDKFRTEFSTLPFEDIAFPRGCNNLKEYSDPKSIYRKGCPIHVRGALVYNNLLKINNLENRYELVKEGEKIKYCYLKLPNTLRENIISVSNNLPKVLDLDKYIDYDLQFSKSFLDPLESILNVIGYSIEHTNTLDSFFG